MVWTVDPSIPTPLIFSGNARIIRDVETHGRTGKELIAWMLANKEHYGVVDPVGAYREAIGKLSIDFSLLHFILERMSWGVWGLEETLGSILTKDLRTSHLAEKLLASADKVFPSTHAKAFGALLKRAGKIAKQRNELLHSLWIISEAEILCRSRRRGILTGDDFPSLQKLKAFDLSIFALLDDLLAFETAHIKSLKKPSQSNDHR